MTDRPIDMPDEGAVPANTPSVSPLTDRGQLPAGVQASDEFSADVLAEGAAVPVNAAVVTEKLSDEQAKTLTADGLMSEPTAKWRLYVRRFFRNKMATVGVFIFVLLVLLSTVGGLLTPHDYRDVDFLAMTVPPGHENHIWGTNGVGNDLLAMVVHGLQRSLIIGITVSLATVVISALVGAFAAYKGGRVEKVILTIIHFLLVVPSFLILALIANDRGGDWRALIGVLILFGWMYYARVVWTLTLSLREREYVSAARYMGLGAFYVVRRHIVPNIGSMLTINFALGVVSTVMSETALSFLGFGVKAPDVSLGSLIGSGGTQLVSAPWLFWFPALTLTCLTTSMAFIADGLRDALDPNSQAGGRA